MANDETSRDASPNEQIQITTADPAVVEAPPVSELFPQPPAKAEPQTAAAAPAPAPAPEAKDQASPQEATTPNKGFGVEGEFNVWEGRYSFKNFTGRLLFRAVLTVAWIALAIYVWGTETTR